MRLQDYGLKMIHLVVGRQGSGKTLLLVKTAYESFMRREKIYSNIHLNFDFDKINYEDIINCRLTDCVTLLDEIHLLLPSRLALRKINQEICDNFLSMARKQHNEVYGTTQTLRKVDIRFREEADFVYYCTKYAYIKGQWVEVLHNFNLHPKTPIMVAGERIETYSGIGVKFNFIGNEYFEMYDTYQIIKIGGLDEAMKKKKGK